MEHQGSVTQPDYKEEREIIQGHVKFCHSASEGLPEWQTYPEIPTARDLNPDWDNREDLEKIHSLLPNDWERPFPSKDTYLETHYRLQREEAIAMLRYSVKKYREDPTMADDDETCVYTKVFVRGYLLTRLGPMCRIQFSTERAGKRIRWVQTRRLTTGTLVAISTIEDGFRTICMPAVIADHPIRDLEQIPPTIQIFWGDTDDAIIDPTAELVMLESRSGYFEAVRHCMVGLQHVARTTTPFDKYLVSLDKSDLVARYVQDNPRMNISSLIHHIPDSSTSPTDTVPTDTIRQRLAEAREPLRNYQVLDGINDQISPFTNLDNSQLSAVHRILTKELSIIQGPPGTGKTFTSVQALRILLDSQQVRGRNIVVVAAQTNHAVDQILGQLISLGFNTVRLGGRTQNEEMKRYSMYNLRRRAMPPRKQRAEKDYKTLEAARQRTMSQLEEIVESIFSEALLTPQALQEAGIITQKQLESLLDQDGYECESVDESDCILSQWLTDQRVEPPAIDTTDPDFDVQENDDTADFDIEDYGIDLDDCIADDDENSGRVDGRWVPIKYRWTGANPRNYTETDLVLRKELARDDLWSIGRPYRGAIYQYWQRELLRLQQSTFRTALAANNRICKNLKANRWHKDLRCIKLAQIEIVGCTTTGLCKYRGLIAALQPRTMLIEEAAETKEASILSALYPSLQQLILVGDHQQLAPSCDTPFLDEEPYNLRVSMFERLVKLHMPYTMLNMQRRMHPSLREVLSPFYRDLKDHPVVSQPDARPPVPGMAQRSFFFHHTWNEGTDENLSKFNILEAEMIVRFVDYLLMNGVKDTEIAVLTFYRGQRKKILSEFRKMKHREPFKNVHTVDSYQGEENEIVILSLVRSNGPNGPHTAGFLRDSNRGVVSISRARRGFYIFGNAINLIRACEESRVMWGQVQDIFHRQNRFGHDGKLPITCQQHNRTTWISHPNDWINHHGGCSQPCAGKLECGHDCGRLCHWIQHERLICQKPCERTLNCGHRCQRICGTDCKCTCAAFTGAYPNDETWDDNTVAPNAPFVGSDGRVGRPRWSRHELRGRGSYARGGISAHASDDVRRQQEYRQSGGVGPLKPLHTPSCDDQITLDTTTSNILERFRQVTLNPDGTRDIREGVISETSETPSLRNNNVPERSPRTEYILNSSSVAHTTGVARPDPLQQRISTESVPFVKQHTAFVENRNFLPRIPGPYSNRIRAVEDRPEWEDSYTIDRTHDDNSDAHHVDEAREENVADLIEF